MFKNYFLTAWRNMMRNRGFTAINIMGLSMGLASSLLIFLWVRDEKSMDTFHVNGRRLFQVYERNYYDGKVDADYPTQGLLAEELKRTIPQIRYASGWEYASAPGTQNTFMAGDKTARMTGMFAGADFFRMFSFPLLAGTVSGATSQPSGIAISRNMADIFFGGPQNAVGKTIRFDNKENLLVTAVFENVSRASSLQFDFLRSWTDFVAQNEWVHNWGDTDPQTFIQLNAAADAKTVAAQIKDFIYRYQPRSASVRTELALQPFTSRYLYSRFKDGSIDGGRIEYVRLFSIIALFILLIACINFMNLTTARSARRSKEVGVRKVIGAVRFSLIRQFLGEAVFLTALATGLALLLAFLVLPQFNHLTGKQITLPVNQPAFWLSTAALVLVTGFVAGCYPAFFISSFNPVRVLKGTMRFSWSSLILRKGLVVFQFALSVMLMIATVVIYHQMDYVENADLGYQRDHLLYIPIEGALAPKYGVFRQQALEHTAIASVSKMRNSPTVISHHTTSISWPGKDPAFNLGFADGVVGYDFIKTMKLHLVSGRDFSPAFNDSLHFILNETAVRQIGFTSPIGQTVYWGNHAGTVIGVIRDFHFNSLHETIEPLILRLDENWPWGTILVRTKAGETKNALAALQEICHRLNPAFPFTYQFSDREYAKLYQSEQVVSKLAGLFAFLALFISCLGLFGLAMFSAEQRHKEIGIRKVLGASAGNIAVMLSVHFLQPVLVAFVIAFPVAWWAMNDWLHGFAYRVNIGWATFAIAGLAAIVIALMTVGYQSLKAAIANPVHSLHTE